MITLDQLGVGQWAKVLSVRSEGPSSGILSALGLIPGTSVSVERLAPLGDPISLFFEGQRISVRRRDALDVVVQ